ncbi:MAG TPA: hypothetical protein VGK73_36650 [Polyangiaceae bacterium]
MATETDKVNTGALGTLVAVGTFATISIVLGVDALVRYESSQIAAERASHAGDRYRSLVADQTGKLSAEPRVVDKAKGTVTMPITQAMGHVIADLARDPLSASPVPPASAAPVPAAPGPAASGATGELGAVQPEPPADADKTGGGAPASSALPAPAESAKPAPKAPTTASTTSVSPKASAVLAVPATPPAAPPRAPAPAAPAPSDG